METTRQKKISRLIQKEISEILQKEMQGVYRNALITITIVRISPDLSFARLYTSIMTSGDVQKVLDQMNADIKQFRGYLGKRVGKQMRIIPEIRFFLDDTAEYAQKMDRLFSDLNISKEGGDEEE